jgi:hypothetical protein
MEILQEKLLEGKKTNGKISNVIVSINSDHNV